MPKRKSRADGRYEATARINGKKYHFYGATRTEARKKRDDFVELMDRCPLAEKKFTLAEWCDAWVESIRPNVAASTQFSYRHVLSRFIIRAPIGSVYLHDLRPHMFRTYWQQLLDQGYSPRSVIYCHTVTSMALKQAAFDGAILTNPLLSVRRPRLVKKEVKAMTREQLALLIQAAGDPLYRNIIIIGARTGMRREEILGLTWPKVDFDRSTVTVAQTVICTGGKARIVPSTKTKSSMRTIAVDPKVLDVLRAQHAAYLRAKLACPDFQDLSLVFCHEDGSPVHPDSVSHWFRRYADACGLHEFTFHSLRHTHATLLLEAGVNFKSVQARLGHSTFSTTMDTYAHVTPAMEKEVLKAIESTI